MAPSDPYAGPEIDPPVVAQPLSSPPPVRSVALRTRRAVLPAWISKSGLIALGMFIFILALELLKEGTRTYGRDVIVFLQISNAANALGFGWLLAYIFLSGSPVAVVAISFFASGTIDGLQAFTMITGSRLGASFIVLFVGFLYYLRGHRRTVSISIGVLALLTTVAIYLPAMGLGYWILVSGMFNGLAVSGTTRVTSFIDQLYEPIVVLFAQVFPDWAILLFGLGALLLAFQLLDRALPEVHMEHSAFQRIGRLIYRPVVMFLLGAAITSVTLSVSVSLSLLVPLSARGLVRRENTLPYIMGANITTFVDTLFAALISGGPAAFLIVLVEMISVATLSLVVLTLFYRPFERAILSLQDFIIRDNRTLGAFLCLMLGIPIALLLVK